MLPIACMSNPAFTFNSTTLVHHLIRSLFFPLLGTPRFINFHISDDAWTDISNIIARSRRPQGGVVRTAHEWVHGAVRLKISPNFPSVMDYEVLQEYISGITGFATSHGGYWEWRITFEARVRQVEFRTYGRAQMSIARGT